MPVVRIPVYLDGGDIISAVRARLKGVKALCGARGGAFAAIVGDDTVICWGKKGECNIQYTRNTRT